MTIKLPRAVKRAWVRALRNRSHTQGTGLLCQTSMKDVAELQFCCLGVLAHIQRVNVVHMRDDATALLSDDSSISARVGRKTMDALMQDSCGSETVEDRLSAMNDAGQKFYQIARWIDRNL